MCCDIHHYWRHTKDFEDEHGPSGSNFCVIVAVDTQKRTAIIEQGRPCYISCLGQTKTATVLRGCMPQYAPPAGTDKFSSLVLQGWGTYPITPYTHLPLWAKAEELAVKRSEKHARTSDSDTSISPQTAVYTNNSHRN